MAEFRTSIEITASPDAVLEYLITADGMTAWMGAHATLDPRPGGIFQVDIAGSPIRGHYLEVVRPTRVVVSWGVAGSAELPVGSSRVAFSLVATAVGTRVEVTHSKLPEPLVAGHEDGWTHFLPRLRAAATGEPLGQDPWIPLPMPLTLPLPTPLRRST